MKKSEIKTIINNLDKNDETKLGENDNFWKILIGDVLKQKVRFPLLEFIAGEFYQMYDIECQIKICKKIVELDYEGGYVIVAKLLQLQISDDLSQSFQLLELFIIKGDKWYVCDIISERVIGFGLLNYFGETIVYLKSWINHKNDWMKRSVGIGIHNAIKNELSTEYLDDLFNLLQPQLSSTKKQVQKGSGKAIKTMTKYHPEFISDKMERIDDTDINPWIAKKVREGEKRSKKK